MATTPAYQGKGQPTADSGGSWLSRLGSFFGGTPTYAGTGQAAHSVLGTTPAYAAAPAVVTTQADDVEDSCATTARTDPAEVPCLPLDPTALAAGQIAIVIPRSVPCPDSDPSGSAA